MLHLIHNPAARRGRSAGAAAALAAALAGRGLRTRIWTTRAPGHATEIAHALPADATAVAVGGDGTVHEVARACIGSRRVLGVVPAGSGDDFAHALGIGRHIQAAAAVLEAGRVRTVDTGTCNGEPFVNAVGTGLDAEVGGRVADAPPRLTGLGAYLWAVAVSLRDLACPTVRITADGEPAYEGPSLLISCQNGPRTGGSFRLAPNARIDDGMLELMVAGRLGRLAAAALLPRVMAGRHLGHPRVRHVRARTAEIAWSAPRTWHADGEVFPPTATLRIEVRPASLRVIAP